MVALSRNVARKHAMEMLLTGEAVSAEDAYRIGLINRVVIPERSAKRPWILPADRRQIQSHCENRQRGLLPASEMNLAEAYRYVSEVMVENLMTRDAKEGLNAFIDSANRNGGSLMVLTLSRIDCTG